MRDSARVRQSATPVAPYICQSEPGRNPAVQLVAAVSVHAPAVVVTEGYRFAAMALSVASSLVPANCVSCDTFRLAEACTDGVERETPDVTWISSTSSAS